MTIVSWLICPNKDFVFHPSPAFQRIQLATGRRAFWVMLRGSLSLSLSVFMSLSCSFSLFLCLSLPWPIHTLLLAQFLGITLVIPITVCNSLFSIKAQKCQLDTTPWQLPPITKYIYIPWGFLETDQHCWAYSPFQGCSLS